MERDWDAPSDPTSLPTFGSSAHPGNVELNRLFPNEPLRKSSKTVHSTGNTALIHGIGRHDPNCRYWRVQAGRHLCDVPGSFRHSYGCSYFLDATHPSLGTRTSTRQDPRNHCPEFPANRQCANNSARDRSPFDPLSSPRLPTRTPLRESVNHKPQSARLFLPLNDRRSSLRFAIRSVLKGTR